MLIVALVIANLMVSIRRHRDVADAREQRTAVLYAMSRELAVASDAPAMAAAAVRHICAVFHSTAVVHDGWRGRIACRPYRRPTGGRLPPDRRCHAAPSFDLEFAQEVAARGERCVKDAIYLPLRGSRRVKGVIVVCPAAAPLAAHGAAPICWTPSPRSWPCRCKESVWRRRPRRRGSPRSAPLLRNTLLASISHDLRTPLSAIAGAGSLIAQPNTRSTSIGAPRWAI
jgi:two-component system sensor histidine kinase KdpD